MANCANCGAGIQAGASRCIKCGSEVQTQQPAPPAPVYVQAPSRDVQPPVQAPPAWDQSMQKSKIGAGLLGIFLGFLGIHNFYLGYSGKGVAQLLITLLSFGWLSPISGLWGLVEGIMILTGGINKDGRGIPLKD